MLALGSKQPGRDKFNETHFLVDINNFLLDLKNRKVTGEALCEIEAAAKAYAKRVKQTPSNKGVEKARKYLKSNGLVGVPYDRDVGFCVRKKDTYKNKWSDTLDSNQFSESKATSDAIILKIERDIRKEWLAMRKKDEISENLYREALCRFDISRCESTEKLSVDLISLDVKSLYTNVPLKEAIDIALRKCMCNMNHHQLLGKP